MTIPQGGYLLQAEGDPNDEFREHQAQAEESHNNQMEAHFYPSEGLQN